MPNDPYGFNNSQMSEEEYRRRAEAKAKRRKKRQTQRIIILCAFALAAILLVVGIVMIFRAIFGNKDKAKPASSVSATSMSIAAPEPIYAHAIAPNPDKWELRLVNLQNPLPDGFKMSAPEELAVVTEVGHLFDIRAADALKQMVADCNANVEGGSLTIYSGYRGAENQNGRYQRQLEISKGQGLSDAEAEVMALQTEPPAGYSEHQLGLGVDFTTALIAEPSLAFAETPEYQWLTQNAANYGFILRYSSEKEEITGVLCQPYHFRYVGAEDAQAMVASPVPVCLEEYLMAVPTGGGTDTAPDSSLPAADGSTSAANSEVSSSVTA